MMAVHPSISGPANSPASGGCQPAGSGQSILQRTFAEDRPWQIDCQTTPSEKSDPKSRTCRRLAEWQPARAETAEQSIRCRVCSEKIANPTHAKRSAENSGEFGYAYSRKFEKCGLTIAQVGQ
jgi:hypothetical protein